MIGCRPPRYIYMKGEMNMEQRKKLEDSLDALCKACNDAVTSVKIEWDETDTKYRTSAKTAEVFFTNGYSKKVNVACCSFRAIASSVIKVI